MQLNVITNSLIICIALVVILVYGKSLLIPFVFALLFWFLIREVKHLINKVAFLKNALPNWVKNVITSLLFFILLGLFSSVLSTNIKLLSNSILSYESNAEIALNKINNTFNVDLLSLFKNHASDFNFSAILQSIFNSLTEILGNAFIIVFYTIFIFIEEANFDHKLKAILKNKSNYQNVDEILIKVEKSITQYIGLKTLTSVLTGFLSYLILLFIGVDTPLFWAFLIFTLNYIPTVGSMAATLFPTIFALLQFGEFGPPLLVLGLVGATQVVVGNLIEPKLMGNSLNVSSLVAILSLSFWGSIWGITGMILSVPVTVIMVIVFAQFERTKFLAILLSEKGRV